MRGITGDGIDNVVPFRRPPGGGPAAGGALGTALGVSFETSFEASEPAPGCDLLDFAARAPGGTGRRDQRRFLDCIYAAGSLPVAAGDREAKLMASRLQVYGFVTLEEVGPDGSLRPLKPSQAIRARLDRPWRVSKAALASKATRSAGHEAGRDVGLAGPRRPAAVRVAGPVSAAVTIPAADAFLFEAVADAAS